MALSQGRFYLAMPGPSVMPERVLQAMHQPCPNIYEGGLIELIQTLIPDLKNVVGPPAQAAIYTANCHRATEAAASKVFAPEHSDRQLEPGQLSGGSNHPALALRMTAPQLTPA